MGWTSGVAFNAMQRCSIRIRRNTYFHLDVPYMVLPHFTYAEEPTPVSKKKRLLFIVFGFCYRDFYFHYLMFQFDFHAQSFHSLIVLLGGIFIILIFHVGYCTTTKTNTM